VVEAVEAFIDEVLLAADFWLSPFEPQAVSEAATIDKLSAIANIFFILILPLLCEIYSTSDVIISIYLFLFHIYIAIFFRYIALYL